MLAIEQIKKLYNLRNLAQLEFHPNANDYQSHEYITGYKGMFGEPSYGERWIYNRVFTWTTDDNKKFTVVIEPAVTENRYGPVENMQSTMKSLCKFIEQTI